MLKFVMTDIHGGYQNFLKVLNTIDEVYPTEEKQFIFLGDYIDRGPETKQLLNHLQTMDDGRNVFLLGNHDDMGLGRSPNFRSNGQENGFRNWMGNGGDKTLLSYGFPFTQYFWNNLTPYAIEQAMAAFTHADWLKDKPYFYQDERRTYVHAGFFRNPEAGHISKQPTEVLTWIRWEFLNDDRPDGGFVVHGHTPTVMYGQYTPVPDITANRCNLDTGSVYGGVLSCGVFDNEHEAPIAIINSNGEHHRFYDREVAYA